MRETVNDIDEVIKAVLIRNVELSNRVSYLEMENASLEGEIAKLRKQLSRLETPKKDSHNSSIPPSKESLNAKAVRRTRSLRIPSGRPSGGQPGHKGSTLFINPTPDETKLHTSLYCSCCGNSLAEITGKEIETRQSIDIPLPVCQIITNHVSIEKKCSCGCSNRGSFPAYVKPGVSYGVNMHALVAYLSTVQYISFKRLTSVLKDLYGIEISQGSVSNILNRMRKQSQPGYEAIRNRIANAAVVGADETGENVNGKLQWMWTFQNEATTCIFQHSSRGKAAIESHFPAGLPQSMLVTDRHASCFNMETAGHQLCLAHLLRYLIYLSESNQEQTWSPDMLNLLRESIYRRKSVPFGEIDTGDIKDRFNVLINRDANALDKKCEALRKSLVKHKEHIFQFLERENVYLMKIMQAKEPYDH